jgi:hypothetical protein
LLVSVVLEKLRLMQLRLLQLLQGGSGGGSRLQRLDLSLRLEKGLLVVLLL